MNTASAWICLISLLTLGVSVIPLLVRRPFHLFEPIVSGSLMLALLFGARPLYTLLSGDPLMAYGDVAVSNRAFLQVALLGLCSAVMFFAGYLAPASIPTSPSGTDGSRRVDPTRLWVLCISLAIISFSMFMTYLSWSWDKLLMAIRCALPVNGSLNSEYFTMSPMFSASAVIPVVASRENPANVWKRLFIALAIAFPLLTIYSRRFIILSLCPPAVAYCLAGRKSIRSVWLAVAAILFAFVISSLTWVRSPTYCGDGVVKDMTILKMPVDKSVLSGSSKIRALDAAFKHPVQMSRKTLWAEDTAVFAAIPLELEVLQKPSDFYFGLATFGDIFLAPIPHILFPQKPMTARDRLLMKIYGHPCNDAACPDFSVIGTFYQDLWYPGVALGMFLLGYVSSAAWRYYKRDPYSPFSIVTISCWTISLPLIIRAGFMPAFTWFLDIWLPAMVVLWCSSTSKFWKR